MKKNNIILSVALLLSACGPSILRPTPLEDKILRVVNTLPARDEVLDAKLGINIEFSQELDPLSVSDESAIIIKAENLPEDLTKIKSSLGSMNKIGGKFFVTDDLKTLGYVPDSSFEEGEYDILITNALRSVEGMPFCNASSCSSPYISNFFVEGGVKKSSDANSNESVDIIEETPIDSDEPDNSEDASGDSGPAPIKPSFLWINEILYDVPGVDTNGNVFIELYGESGGDIGRYSLVFVNGDDGKTYDNISISENSVIGEDGLFVIADVDSSGNSQVEGSDLLDNFDPQNGPDSVQLVDPYGNLVDAIGYGNLTLVAAQNGLAMYEGAPVVLSGSGKSISRSEGAPDTNNNSEDFVVNTVPSPGSLTITIQD